MKKHILQVVFIMVLAILVVPGFVLARGGNNNVHGNNGNGHGNGNGGIGTVTPVNGTFRTPSDEFSACPETDPVDCQIDWFFGDIGGPDQGNRRGADDKLITVFINEDEFFGNPAPGYWTYRDIEEVTDTRGVFRGFEDGVIDARPGLSTTGNFWGRFKGQTDDGCWSLEFSITGTINLTGILDQSANPVNSDVGAYTGNITQLCE